MVQVVLLPRSSTTTLVAAAMLEARMPPLHSRRKPLVSRLLDSAILVARSWCVCVCALRVNGGETVLGSVHKLLAPLEEQFFDWHTVTFSHAEQACEAGKFKLIYRALIYIFFFLQR